MNNNSLNFSKRGFTLIEVMLYISLTALTILATALIFSLVLENRIRQQTISEVETSGNFAMKIFLQTIRNSTAANNLSVENLSSSFLVLTFPNPEKNPTTLELANGTLRITEGPNPTIDLTSSGIIVSDLLFQNFGPTGSKEAIQVRFTVSKTNSSMLKSLNYQQIFYGGATIR